MLNRRVHGGYPFFAAWIERSVDQALAPVAGAWHELPDAKLERWIDVLVRLITGYFLQALLSDRRALNVGQESGEIAAIVKLYLQHRGISHAD